jgi:predicted Ser/Thr protein kinase/predicted hydrocarbon binding protein
MLGVIFFVLQNHVEKRLGPSSWGRVVSLANLPAKSYSPIADYPDSEAMALLAAASQLAGKPLGEFLEEFGEALAPELLAMYPGLVQPEWKTLDLVTNAEEVIHSVVRRRNPSAKPPVLRCARYSADEVQVVYASPRKLCRIAKGIIRGVARHYQEEVSITDESCMNDGDPFCAIQIKLVASDVASVGPRGSVGADKPVVPAAAPVEEQASNETPSAQFSAMWRHAERPDLKTFLAAAGKITAEQLSQILCVDQRERWMRGERPGTEYYLNLCRSLQPSSEYAVDILYNEFLVRREIGEAPAVDEYRDRFPELVEQLQVQVNLRDALGTAISAGESSGRKAAARLSSPIRWTPPSGYEILGELGRGGMGVVYKAHQNSLQRLVAIKVIAADLAAEAGILARFQRERFLLAQLAHPNVVAAYDAGESGGLQYFVMEFVDGVSFATLVKQPGRLPVVEVCELIRQTAVGLQHIHEHGLVHRDIKPSNLLLTPSGTVKLIDLSLARWEQGPTHGQSIMTNLQTLGTFDYIAPEQCEDSHSVDIRADIYSLGCTFYELLSGRAPFAAFGSVLMKIRAHALEPIPPIQRSRVDVPMQLAVVLERMVAKDRNNRFSTPAEINTALQPFATGANLSRLVSS